MNSKLANLHRNNKSRQGFSYKTLWIIERSRQLLVNPWQCNPSRGNRSTPPSDRKWKTKRTLRSHEFALLALYPQPSVRACQEKERRPGLPSKHQHYIVYKKPRSRYEMLLDLLLRSTPQPLHPRSNSNSNWVFFVFFLMVDIGWRSIHRLGY